MIQKVASIVCLFLVCLNLAQNSTLPNYFVDLYEGVYYGYPLDICLATGVLDLDYVIFTCNDNDEVIKQVWKNSACTNADYNVTFTKDDIKDNGVYDYNCGGITSYMEIKVCTGTADCLSGCTIGGTTYSVPGLCHYGGDNTNGTVNEVRTATCDETDATISFYNNTDTCGGDASPIWETTSDECLFFSSVTVGQATLEVYAQLTECVINGTSLITGSPTSLPTMAPTSGVAHFNVGINMICALLLGVLSILAF